MHFLFTFHAYSVSDKLKYVGWSVYTEYGYKNYTPRQQEAAGACSLMSQMN